ncbi:gluconate transport inducer 1/Pac2, partial [Kalaharituber pfeilii]
MRPTMKCQIISTKDALILVQRCLQGLLQPITRRPHDRERTELVQPGNVFVYTESESGIKRWTDGVNWSPSRILNNFLVYRELDKAFPPGEKKKAAKRTKRYTPYDRNSPGNRLPQQNNSANGEGIVVDGAHRLLSKDEERMLVGSLNESYCFKKDGLIKKTISITHNNQTWHVVWYYSYLAFLENKFPRPEHCWPNTVLSPELTGDQNFRCPLN